jgi:hypothetical protein
VFALPGEPEILLQGKIEVIHPRISDVRIIARRVSKRLVGVPGAGKIDKPATEQVPKKSMALVLNQCAIL